MLAAQVAQQSPRAHAHDQVAEQPYFGVVDAHHIVRRVNDTEVRLLSNLIMRMSPGALLGDLSGQHNVFKDYWALASADSFRAVDVQLAA